MKTLANEKLKNRFLNCKIRRYQQQLKSKIIKK